MKSLFLRVFSNRQAVVSTLLLVALGILMLLVFTFTTMVRERSREVGRTFEREKLNQVSLSANMQFAGSFHSKEPSLEKLRDAIISMNIRELEEKAVFTFDEGDFPYLGRVSKKMGCSVEMSVRFVNFDSSGFIWPEGVYDPDAFEKYGELELAVRTSGSSSGTKVITGREIKVINILPPVLGRFTLFVRQPVEDSILNSLDSDISGRPVPGSRLKPVIVINTPSAHEEIDEPFDLCGPGWIFLGGGDWIFNLTGDAGNEASVEGAGESFQLLAATNIEVNRYQLPVAPAVDVFPFEMGFVSRDAGWNLIAGGALAGSNRPNRSSLLHLYGEHARKSPTLVLGLVSRSYLRANSLAWRKEVLSGGDFRPARVLLKYMEKEEYREKYLASVELAKKLKENPLDGSIGMLKSSLALYSIPNYCSKDGMVHTDVFISKQPWGALMPKLYGQDSIYPVPLLFPPPDGGDEDGYEHYRKLMAFIVPPGAEHYNTGIDMALAQHGTVRKGVTPVRRVLESAKNPVIGDGSDPLAFYREANDGRNLTIKRNGDGKTIFKGDLEKLDISKYYLSRITYSFLDEKRFRQALCSDGELYVKGILFVRGGLNLNSPAGRLRVREGGVIVTDGDIIISCSIERDEKEPLTLVSLNGDVIINTGGRIDAALIALKGSLRKSGELSFDINGLVAVNRLDFPTLAAGGGYIRYDPVFDVLDMENWKNGFRVYMSDEETYHDLEMEVE